MLTWRFERDGLSPTMMQVGWGGKAITVEFLLRDDGEPGGYLENDRWLSFRSHTEAVPGYHPQHRYALGMGSRLVVLWWDGINADYASPEAQAIREADNAARRAERQSLSIEVAGRRQ